MSNQNTFKHKQLFQTLKHSNIQTNEKPNKQTKKHQTYVSLALHVFNVNTMCPVSFYTKTSITMSQEPSEPEPNQSNEPNDENEEEAFVSPIDALPKIVAFMRTTANDDTSGLIESYLSETDGDAAIVKVMRIFRFTGNAAQTLKYQFYFTLAHFAMVHPDQQLALEAKLMRQVENTVYMHPYLAANCVRMARIIPSLLCAGFTIADLKVAGDFRLIFADVYLYGEGVMFSSNAKLTPSRIAGAFFFAFLKSCYTRVAKSITLTKRATDQWKKKFSAKTRKSFGTIWDKKVAVAVKFYLWNSHIFWICEIHTF